MSLDLSRRLKDERRKRSLDHMPAIYEHGDKTGFGGTVMIGDSYQFELWAPPEFPLETHKNESCFEKA